jgi:prepilin-type N-terminal cleavage/methylation domain-containing protein
MKNTKSARGGFTLVEIMIVVAIIGLLATMAIPNFIEARETARKQTCIGNLQQIDGAVQRWALDLRKDSTDPVTFADISLYLRNSVTCPSGGTSFADSYTISTADAKPTCQRRPDKHVLPL